MCHLKVGPTFMGNAAAPDQPKCCRSARARQEHRDGRSQLPEQRELWDVHSSHENGSLQTFLSFPLEAWQETRICTILFEFFSYLPAGLLCMKNRDVLLAASSQVCHIPYTFAGANFCIIPSYLSEPKFLMLCSPNPPGCQLFMYFWLNLELGELRDAWRNQQAACLPPCPRENSSIYPW